MPGPKTNEREGTRAVLRHVGVSPYKVREVIDVIRGKPVREAADMLNYVERDAALLVGKLLRSAVANAANNDGLDPEDLYVSACYVDEGPTAKRWRPRARGRASRIRKRSSHVTVIVSRMPEHRLARLQARRHAENLTMRSRRVEATRRARAESAEGATRRERRHPEEVAAAQAEPAVASDAVASDAVASDAVASDAVASDAVAPELAGDVSGPGAANEQAAAAAGDAEAAQPGTGEAGSEQDKDS